jgi:hypothetical protein
MRYWAWLLKWGWIAGGLFVLVVVLATWHPTSVDRVDESAESLEGSAADAHFAKSGEDSWVTPGAIGSAPTTSLALPYGLVFTYGFLPLTLNGQSSPALAEFYHAQIGDVTGDGRDDLVSLGYVSDFPNDEVLHVYPQMPDGTLGAPDRYLVPQDIIIGLALADMNNDKTKDVVVTSMQRVSLALSDGHGKLRVVPFSSTTGDKKSIDLQATTLDLDRDGNLDVIAHLSAADSSDSTQDRRSRFRVFYGDGQGGTTRSGDFAIFGVETHDYGAYDRETPTALVVKDVNRDGYQDIVMASRRFIFAEQQSPPFISFYANDRSGGFLAPIVMEANIPGETSAIVLENLSVGDFNDDGRQDIAAAPFSNFTDVYVFLQTAAGTFGATPSYSRQAGLLVKPMAGVDLDTDGQDDLLIGHSNVGQIGFHLQNDGMLGEETNVPLSGFAGYQLDGGIDPSSLATGDLNSDGCTDVAVAVTYNGLQVFMGQNCVRRIFTGGRLPPSRL